MKASLSTPSPPPPMAINPTNDGHKQHPKLLIDVPKSFNELSFSGNESMFNSLINSDAMDLDPPQNTLGDALIIKKLFSPTQEDFDSITQLPTPIINNGSFGSFSPIEGSPLDVHKIRGKSSLKRQGSLKERTISEYKPLERRQVTSTLNSKRVASNPVQNLSPDGSVPSPPSEDDLYERQVFYSSKFDKYFKYVKLIGKGNFSDVVLAEEVDNPESKLAIKIIKIPFKSRSQIKNYKYFLKRELNILFQLRYPNVIQLLDYNINLSINANEIETNDFIESESDFEDLTKQTEDSKFIKADYESLTRNNNQLIFLNYCPGGNLFEFSSRYFRIHNKNPKYWQVVLIMVKEILLSINYIHLNLIIHRDIKLENVLLNYSIQELLDNLQSVESITCLTDFGLAKRLKSNDQLLSTRCGSQDYVAPEVLMGLKYNGFLTDSWAVGVLIYCLLEDRLPFDLPSYNYLTQTGVSPSVIKRKMTKNTPAHRIAMIDWDWYVINDILADESLDSSTKLLINNLKSIVEVFLVRKDRRKTVAELLNDASFSWIKH